MKEKKRMRGIIRKEGSYNSPINLISFPFLSNFLFYLSLSLSSFFRRFCIWLLSVSIFDEETDGSYTRRVDDGGDDWLSGGGGASSTPQARRNGGVREYTSVTVGFSQTKVETRRRRRRRRLFEEGDGIG